MFPNDLRRLLATAVELVNSRGDVAQEEMLGDLESVEMFIKRSVITDARRTLPVDVVELHGLRDRLRAIFDVAGTDVARERINELLGAAMVRPRVTEHDDLGLHIHYFLPGASVSDHLTADLGMALAQLLVAGELCRLRACAAPGCGRFFLDTSRNRSRRYCDTGLCGNRMNAAAYRARRRVT